MVFGRRHQQLLHLGKHEGRRSHGGDVKTMNTRNLRRTWPRRQNVNLEIWQRLHAPLGGQSSIEALWALEETKKTSPPHAIHHGPIHGPTHDGDRGRCPTRKPKEASCHLRARANTLKNCSPNVSASTEGGRRREVKSRPRYAYANPQLQSIPAIQTRENCYLI